MTEVYSFPAISANDARVLILGSMPGEVSLAKQQYYAHPRNSFWFIMEQLFKASSPLDYEQRKQLLIDNKIALWDVLKACVRLGSLDSSIKNNSVIANEFAAFFNQHSAIKAVFFNGARAEKEFSKHVMPQQEIQALGLEYHRLPSTSPAHAAMSREKKLSAWSIVAEKVSLFQ